MGLGNRSNMVLQAAFFKLARVIPVEDAVAHMKDAVKKTYGLKGEKVVNMNIAAVDAGLLSDVPPLGRFIAVVGAERDRLPGYLVVQTAEAASLANDTVAGRVADPRREAADDRDGDDDAEIPEEEAAAIMDMICASQQRVRDSLAKDRAMVEKVGKDLSDLSQQITRLQAPS